jgi:hypothetical protein
LIFGVQLCQVLLIYASPCEALHSIACRRFLPDASLLAFADEQVEMLHVVVF